LNNDIDLFEAAVTLVVIVKSIWSTVEIIVQASDDIIKVVPKMKINFSKLRGRGHWSKSSFLALL